MFRKKHSTENDWQNVIWEGSKKSVEDIISLKNKAQEIILSNYNDNVLIGYTGGKDSLVLRHLAEDCLQRPRFISCVLENEYPKFAKWISDTEPADIQYVFNHQFSLEFLNNHLDYLFPIDKKIKNKYVVAWHHPTYEYMLKNGFTHVMTAKRTADGNNCGKENDRGCKTTYIKNGITTFNPLADWTHADLFAYINYFKIEMPCIYSQKDGYRQGTHSWTKEGRVNNSYKETFDLINSIDPEIITKASERLDVARLYLQGKLNF